MVGRQTLESLVTSPARRYRDALGISTLVQAYRAFQGDVNLLSMLSFEEGGFGLDDAFRAEFAHQVHYVDRIAQSLEGIDHLPETVTMLGYGVEAFMYTLPFILPPTCAYIGARALKGLMGTEHDIEADSAEPGTSDTIPQTSLTMGGEVLCTWGKRTDRRKERNAPALPRFMMDYARLYWAKRMKKDYRKAIEDLVERSPQNYQLLSALHAAQSREIMDDKGEGMFAMYEVGRRTARQYVHDVMTGLGYRHFQFPPLDPESKEIVPFIESPAAASGPERAKGLLLALQLGSMEEFLSFHDALYDAYNTDNRAEDIFSVEHVKDEFRDEYIASLKRRGIDELRERLSFLGIIAHQRNRLTPSAELKTRKERSFTQLYKFAKKLTAGNVGDLFKVGQTRHGFYTLTSGTKEIGFKEGETIDGITHEFEVTRQLRDRLRRHTEYSVPEPMATLEVDFIRGSAPVLVMEYVQGETLERKIINQDRPLMHLAKAVGMLGLLQSCTIDIELEEENYMDKISSRLYGNHSQIPRDAANRIMKHYGPVIEGFRELPHALELDYHPENILFSENGQVMKIDNEGHTSVPFVFDHANILNYTPGISDKHRRTAREQAWRAYNTNAKRRVSWQDYSIGYHNAVLHRCISLCSAWSRPDRESLRPRRVMMVENGLSAIADLQMECPEYASAGDNRDHYAKLEHAFNTIKAAYAER